MKAYRFRAQALTPVHIGCGCEIEPMEFILHGERVVQFNPARVLSELPPAEMDRYIRLVDKADLPAIHSFLRTHVRPEIHATAQIDASQAFRSEFDLRIGNPNNRFRVELMPRNPHSGQIYLPGSSIKGAIRTAVVNHFANLAPESRETVHAAVNTARDSDKGRVLEEAALNRTSGQTERDIFRLVEVEDAPLPFGATRIDRIVNMNPAKKGAEKIQIWAERLKALTDAPAPAPAPLFSITLHIDTLALANPDVRTGRKLDIDLLIRACNSFYWERMKAEGDKFDERLSDGAGWKALHNAFPKGRTPDGGIVAIEPSKPYWCRKERKRMILRVGRFSHFESLSVDGLRRGYNVQARKPIKDMGASRTRCAAEDNRPSMPFGWLILTMDETPPTPG